MIRILLADDHPVVRKGLKDILINELQGAICGEEAKNAQETLEKVERRIGTSSYWISRCRAEAVWTP